MTAGARIDDYGLIADGHTAALVHRGGSIDWYCPRRLDSSSVFAEILDEHSGGRLALAPRDPDARPERRYLEGTMVLETTWNARGGRARVLDLLPVDPRSPENARRQLVRIVEGLEGEVDFALEIAPRFDFGEASPWIHQDDAGTHFALAGDDALLIACAALLRKSSDHELSAAFTVARGERVRLELRDVAPESLGGDDAPQPSTADMLDDRLEETAGWWRDWARQAHLPQTDRDGVLRSALVLKALSNPLTGAIAAAVTTSLPESREGRTWDYRYSWVRDAVFSSRSLAALGFEDAADRFRRFIQRSSAGHADELRIAYGVGGERRMPEIEIGSLRGWRGIGPVRIGNGAGAQRQHDVLGQILDLAWHWHERGRAPDDELWEFLAEIVERAVREWHLPDRGLWEWRGDPRHFTHSKVMCWVAIDRGVRMAQDTGREAPVARWRAARDELRAEIEARGYDPRRGVFVQSFDDVALDAALARLCAVGFVEAGDERMLRTADAIAAHLDDDGLVRRYAIDDDQPGREGAFLPCAFWLAQCLAEGGRKDAARRRFDRAVRVRNDLGLFSEEYDTDAREPVGNFPQALTHFSHILAALALEDDAADRQSADVGGQAMPGTPGA
jgi:GH15 family glucan-1,4-alpha-glucosidase